MVPGHRGEKIVQVLTSKSGILGGETGDHRLHSLCRCGLGEAKMVAVSAR